MAKIKNTTVYPLKIDPALPDYLIGTDSETPNGQTKTFPLSGLVELITAGLDPETGGFLKITQFEDDTETSPAEAANSLVPTYSVARYELVFFDLNGHQYLLKQQNVTIGFGSGTTLTDDDFIDFPVATGLQGKGFRNLGAWSPSTAYVNNSQYIDVVTLNGSSYLCKLSNTNQTPPNSTYWDLIASKGDQGASYRTLGVWNSGTAYVNNSQYIDVVTIGTVTYACKLSNTNQSPPNSTYWDILVQPQNGTNGNTILYGSGAPSNGTGTNGDSYLDTTNYVFYAQKSGGAWPAGVSLIGGVDNKQKTIPSGDYTVLSGDNGYTIFINNSGVAGNITVPSTLPDKFVCFFIQQGSGTMSFVAGSGVTINTPNGLKIKGQNYWAAIEKVGATAVYHLTGALKVS